MSHAHPSHSPLLSAECRTWSGVLLAPWECKCRSTRPSSQCQLHAGPLTPPAAQTRPSRQIWAGSQPVPIHQKAVGAAASQCFWQCSSITAGLPRPSVILVRPASLPLVLLLPGTAHLVRYSDRMGAAIGLRDTGMHATTMGQQAAAVDTRVALWVQIRQPTQRWACGWPRVCALAV